MQGAHGVFALAHRFIVADMGFTLSEKALLLGAFYPVSLRTLTQHNAAQSTLQSSAMIFYLSVHLTLRFRVRAVQGYLITQIPAGFLIQKYGGKIMLTINMVGTGLCTALLPMTLQSARPVLLTWITLTISGKFVAY